MLCGVDDEGGADPVPPTLGLTDGTATLPASEPPNAADEVGPDETAPEITPPPSLVVGAMPGVSEVVTYTRPTVNVTVAIPSDARLLMTVMRSAPESIDSSVLAVSTLEPVLVVPSV